MPELFGPVETITITRKEYDETIRDRERLNILRRIVKASNYISLKELKAILEIEDDEIVPELKHPSVDLDDYADC